MKRLLLPASIMLIAFSGCKKEVPVYYTKDKDIIKAISIKEGSYFIYRDSLSGTLDTFNVYSFSHSISAASDDAYKIERYRYAMHNLQDDEYEFGADYESIGLRYSITGAQHHTYVMKLFKSPFPVGQVSTESFPGEYSDTFKYLRYYDTLSIAGKVYPRVYETYSYMASGTDTSAGTTFYSVDSGLVRLRLLANGIPKNWQLIDSRIIR